MATVFTRIIDGELPGRFVWRDERAVAFLSIAPLKPGHTLVIPREEIDHWIDCPPDLLNHLMSVAHGVGKAVDRAFNPPKVGLMLAGLEVPHVHIHVLPIWGVNDLDFANAEQNPDPDRLDRDADSLRAALRDLGYEAVST